MNEPWTHGWADLSECRLHYVHTGERPGAPLVLLLHGFPEFWYSWRNQIPALADAGFHVVAPDMRGFNLSDKPRRVADYRVEALAADIAELVRWFGEERACVVGHDWGGYVAWHFAMWHPERLDRLAIVQCPHPWYRIAMMSSTVQRRKSRYMLMMNLPFGFPEWSFRRGDFAILRKLLKKDPERPDAFTDEDIERYVAAFAGDTPRAAMSYYRAMLRGNPFAAAEKLRPIDRPVQVVWARGDRHLGAEFSEPPSRWVWDLRYDAIEGGSHWVQCDRPREVNALLLDFLPSAG